MNFRSRSKGTFLFARQANNIFNVVSRNESMEKGGWKVALAEIVEGVLRDDRSFVRKCESKLRHTRCVWNGSDCKSALLGPNHARLSTKLSRSQQNLRNRGATRGGGVAARCVETTSCSRTKKLVDGGGFVMREKGVELFFSKMKDEMESIMEEQKLLFNCFFLFSYRHLFFSWGKICVSFRFWIYCLWIAWDNVIFLIGKIRTALVFFITDSRKFSFSLSRLTIKLVFQNSCNSSSVNKFPSFKITDRRYR